MFIVRLISTFVILSMIYEDYKTNKKNSTLNFVFTVVRKHVVLIVTFSLLIILSIFTNPVENLLNWGIMYVYIFVKNISFFDIIMSKTLTIFNALLAMNILNGT